MKREINPRLSYKKNTIQVLSDLSRTVGIQKKFIDMTRDDILYKNVFIALFLLTAA
jgi:hypothetical protein